MMVQVKVSNIVVLIRQLSWIFQGCYKWCSVFVVETLFDVCLFWPNMNRYVYVYDVYSNFIVETGTPLPLYTDCGKSKFDTRDQDEEVIIIMVVYQQDNTSKLCRT